MRLRDKIRFMFIGMMAVIAGLSLISAADPQAVSNIGRYQISSFSGNDGYGLFIVDTLTGKTKLVYRLNGHAEINNLNKSFGEIKTGDDIYQGR